MSCLYVYHLSSYNLSLNIYFLIMFVNDTLISLDNCAIRILPGARQCCSCFACLSKVVFSCFRQCEISAQKQVCDPKLFNPIFQLSLLLIVAVVCYSSSANDGQHKTAEWPSDPLTDFQCRSRMPGFLSPWISGR